MPIVQVKRGTRAQIETAKTASGLLAGEPYLITDEGRLAVGTSTDTYTDCAKKSEVDAKLPNTTSLTEIGAALVDADEIPVYAASAAGNRKSLLSRVWTYIQGKLASGGNVLIGTTTDDGVGKLQVAGNITTTGYSKLGESAPKIKIKKLSGYNTSESDGGGTSMPHGLTASKIISVSAIVFYGTSGGIHPGYEGGAGYNFSYAFDSANVTVLLVSGQNTNIRNKPIVVFITYEE